MPVRKVAGVSQASGTREDPAAVAERAAANSTCARLTVPITAVLPLPDATAEIVDACVARC